MASRRACIPAGLWRGSFMWQSMNPPMESMSPSEPSAKLSALIAELGAQIERTIQAGELAEVRGEDLKKLMSGAVKLYAARVEETEPGAETDPVVDDTVSTTEAMVVACAL